MKQERELCERISEMEAQSLDDEIRPELRSKLADLENGFKEVERESAKAFSKTVPFLGKVGHQLGLLTIGKYGFAEDAGDGVAYQVGICGEWDCVAVEESNWVKEGSKWDAKAT